MVDDVVDREDVGLPAHVHGEASDGVGLEEVPAGGFIEDLGEIAMQVHASITPKMGRCHARAERPRRYVRWPVVTFQLPEHDTSSAIDALTAVGFEFGPPRTVTTTLVDTFDGRIHRAGLRLELRRAEAIELVLSGEDVVPAHLVVSAAPRVLADLPTGPFRSRIVALVDVRALLPQLRVRLDHSTGVWRDGTGKVVAVAELHEDVRVVGRPNVVGSTTIEIHEVPGYAEVGPPSRRRAARCWNRRASPDTLEQCAAAAGIDLAGFTANATVPLERDMAALDGFRLVCANLATTMVANWQGTIDQTDTVFLHQLRIAVRRTRTVLGAAKSVLPAAVLEPARDGFAWLATSTGAARDLDVYLLEWDHYIDPLGPAAASALTPVRELLERRCADAHRELGDVLRSERAAELLADWRMWLDEPVPEPLAARRCRGEPEMPSARWSPNESAERTAGSSTRAA